MGRLRNRRLRFTELRREIDGVSRGMPTWTEAHREEIAAARTAYDTRTAQAAEATTP
ncbi:hypothetical protein ACWGBH_23570 [Streptomyces massasporeus]